ncbi:hypothetical protein ACSBR2_008180 [Camellia fascicularis]
MKLFMWNCRGAANLHFHRHLRELLNDHHPQLVVIMETGMGGDKGKAFSSNLGFSSMHVSKPGGFGGGIWLFWNDSKI